MASAALLCLSIAPAALHQPTIGRRSAILGAASAATTWPTLASALDFIEGKQRQGTGQFMKGLNRAILDGDAEGVKSALALFDLKPTDQDAAVAIKHTGEAKGNMPVITSTTSGLTSAKITMSVPDATMEKTNAIKLLWLRDAETGDLITCRELTKLSEKPEMMASVPKGRTIVPVAYSIKNGVWVGEPVST